MPIPKGKPVSGIPRGKPIRPSPEEPPETTREGGVSVTRLPQQDPGGTFGERLQGLGQAGVSLGSSMLAEPAAGLAGILDLTVSALEGEEDPLSSAVGRIEAVRNLFTAEPTTDVGETILANLVGEEDMQRLSEKASETGLSAFDITGSPMVGTGVETALQLLPELAAAKPGFKAVPRRGGVEEPEVGPPRPDRQRADIVEEPLGKARRQDIRRVSKILKKEGIDVSSRKGLMSSLERIGRAVQEPGFADAMKRVRDAVVKNKEAEVQLENALWKQAREGGEGFVPSAEISQFRNYLDEALDGFELDDMPATSRMLQRFDENLQPIPDQSSAKISALYRWRKRINKNMPTEGTPDHAAMVTMKKNLDHFLHTQFATDMIRGDPSAIARWRQAIDKSAEIRTLFEDEKFMRQLAEQDATPEELRNFLFNASAVGMKADAGRLIGNLKKVLGEDSPEFKALRNESSFNLMEPLLQEFPDYKAFMKRYEDFVKRNPTALEQLWPENSRNALKAVYSAAKSAKSRRSFRNKLNTDLRQAGPVILFGHGIAQAGLKVRIAKNVMDRMVQADTTPIKSEIMRDFLDYDPTVSAFREPMKRAAVLGTTARASEEIAEREDESMAGVVGAP